MTARAREKKILQAWLETPTRGYIELSTDWRARHAPPINLGPGAPRFAELKQLPDLLYARRSGYYYNHHTNLVTFCLWPDQLPADIAQTPPALYVAGDFNDWQNSVGNPDWQLRTAKHEGSDVFLWTGPAAQFFAPAHEPPKRFKFVTAGHLWLEPPGDAYNVTRDDKNNTNRFIDPARTGHHLYQFALAAPLDLATNTTLYWHDDEQVTIRPGAFFTQLTSDASLGAIVLNGETLFRIFAPRATRVELCVIDDLALQEKPHRYPLTRRADHTWEITLTQDLHGWYYWYHIDGPKNEYTRFNPAQRILDPYARATVDRDGPGIVIDHEKVPEPPRTRFRTPAWQDLVICEAHTRDLIAHAPLDLTPEERLTFAGLKKWIEHPRFYLHRLGINCVELQPVQEFDNAAPGDYHWGYMTTNYFAPESSYGMDPAHASSINEFQDVVAAFHRRGIAVVLDVVYNHVGDPAHLIHIDQLTYFHTDRGGTLSNWSGCGNDINADSAMARRLIIDSLKHFVTTYAVDGFRFDLADLLGFEALKEIEVELKRLKPDVILIAEPWSFKGHIAGQLRDTGWASWNDGYRNFLRDYVRGGGNHETYEYYLKGSPWHYAKWPAQTINYTESHDDRCWLDVITENADNNGNIPTYKDRRRTRLMAAVLFMSIGVPMISAGQDFLRSKQGINNTYLRGDINALDYTRILRFPSTHAYFTEWINFRLSESGRPLRQYSRPSDEFFRFFFAENSTAAATVYNADCEQGPRRLLFAINPTDSDVSINLSADVVSGEWIQIADHDQFYGARAAAHPYPAPTENLFLPPLTCVLWESV